MTEKLKDLAIVIIKAMPNFLGLLISVYVLWLIQDRLMARIEILTNLLLTCNTR